MIDVIHLTQNLIKKPSITPHDNGCLDFIANLCSSMGGVCERLDKNDVSNLLVKFGSGNPTFCFAGHTDVVPPGNIDQWKFKPFEAIIDNGYLYGRGVSDMKGSIAAFLAALEAFSLKKGTIYLLLTSDEEGDAVNGTRYVINILKNRNVRFDLCLVGEPTNVDELGEVVKVGRRGSVNANLRVFGKQGHVAYPYKAINPIPILAKLCNHLTQLTLDDGYDHFEPSHLEFTSIKSPYLATNVIPCESETSFNVRFNPNFTRDSLIAFLTNYMDYFFSTIDQKISWNCNFSGDAEPFLNNNIDIQNIVIQAIKNITHKQAKMSTNGGTSDARFLKDIGPTIEFGLHSSQAHQCNENIKVEDIIKLKDIYLSILSLFFNKYLVSNT